MGGLLGHLYDLLVCEKLMKLSQKRLNLILKLMKRQWKI